jgi:hypothetical protein
VEIYLFSSIHLHDVFTEARGEILLYIKLRPYHVLSLLLLSPLKFQRKFFYNKFCQKHLTSVTSKILEGRLHLCQYNKLERITICNKRCCYLDEFFHMVDFPRKLHCKGGHTTTNSKHNFQCCHLLLLYVTAC